jgi:hypothetical protein
MTEGGSPIGSLPFAFAASIAPALGGDLETTRVRAVRHGADAISLEIEAVRNVGLTFWAHGEIEMTWWDPTGEDEGQMQHYAICSGASLDEFLYDLRVRLHG